jgi:myosin heavy subunit
MSELAAVRTPEIVASEIKTIRQQAERYVVSASVEIGCRLVEAKEMVPHGKWAEWLEQEVNYSQRTANNLMRFYTEYGDEQKSLFSKGVNSQSIANLSYTKAVALFDVPADERESFIEEVDPDNLLSVRELKEIIKKREQERDEALIKLEEAATDEEIKKELEKTQNEKQAIEEKLSGVNKEIADKEEKRAKAEADLVKTKEKLKKAKEETERLKNIKSELSPEEKQQLTAEAEKKANEKFENELKELNADIASLSGQKEELEKKLSLAGNQYAQQFKYLFEEYQEMYNKLSGLILKVKNTGATELADKFTNALKAILQQQSEGL